MSYLAIGNTATPIKRWKVLLVLGGFPLLYQLYHLTPFAQELFVNHNHEYFTPFWVGVTLLNWLLFIAVITIVQDADWKIRDLGYFLGSRQTAVLVSGYLALALAVFGLTEWLLPQVVLDPVRLQRLPEIFPQTTAQRLVYILLVFSAAFCQEFIYRGFALRALVRLGLKPWLAVVPAAVSFAFVHGLGGYPYFGAYLAGGLLLGALFLLTKRLLPGLILNLLLNLVGMLAIFLAVR